MRKLETQMINALKNKLAFRSDNTEVTQTGEVFLHGHKIATLNDSTLSISWCGYITKTTTSRLDKLVKTFTSYKGAGISKGRAVLFSENFTKVAVSSNETIKFIALSRES